MATTDIYYLSAPTVPAKNAVRFLGGDVDDGVQVDAFVATRTAANDDSGTIIAWVNIPDITGTYTILGMGDANVVEYIHFSVESGKMFAACNDATTMQWDVNTTDVVITPHKWHHVALVQKNGDFGPKFYVDGVLKARTDTTTTDLDEWIVNLDGLDGGHIGAADSIGGAAALTQEFKGAISDVKYYNTALTAAQIIDDMNGVVLTTGLTNRWKLSDDLIDNIAAEDGTAVGAIVFNAGYSEFASRLGFRPAAQAVVADVVTLAVDEKTGYAVIIKAA